jgi:glycosyltransferase involved in cell wall biosynthesis
MLLVDSTFTTRGFGGIAQDNRDFVAELRQYRNTFFLYDANVVLENAGDKKLRSSMRKINARSLVSNRTIKMLDWQGDYYQTHLTGLKHPNKNGRVFLRLHDIFPLTNPEWFTWQGRKIFSLAASSLSENTTLVCNSKTTQNIAMRNPLFSKFESLVVPCNINKDIEISKPCNSCHYCLNGAPKEKFLLAVGTVEPRKNYERLIQGWQKARIQSSFEKLLIVGKPGWKSYQTQKMILADKSIIWLSPCDFGLSQLFKIATAFISASLAEGFDIPSVRAYSLAIPSALSAIDAHIEFCHGAKIFFDPNSENQISAAIKRLGKESKEETPNAIGKGWHTAFEQFANQVGIKKNLFI